MSALGAAALLQQRAAAAQAAQAAAKAANTPTRADHVGDWLGHSISFGLGAISTPLANPITRIISQGFDRFTPSHLPSYDQLVRLYYQGFITETECYDWLRSLGIGINVRGEGAAARRILWQNVVKSGRPTFPVDLLYRAWCLHPQNEELLRYEFKRHGFKSEQQWQLFSNDSTALTPHLIFELRARDIITDDEVDKFLRHGGYADGNIRDLLKRMSSGLSVGQALTLWLRGVVNSDEANKYLKWEGYRDDRSRQLAGEMRWQWPSTSEVVRWAQLGAADEQYVARMGLDNEMPELYRQLARANGERWQAGDTPPVGWPNPTITPSDYSWRAHWRVNALSDAILMYQRLRPTGGVNGGPRVAGVEPYTDDDFERDLSANGIMPGRRAQYRTIIRALPRHTVNRAALDYGVISHGEALERVKDYGYDDRTAQVLVQTWEHQRQQKQVDTLKPLTLAQIKEAYKVGVTSRDRTAMALYSVYLDDYAKVQDYLAQPDATKLSQALANPFVQMSITTIDIEIQSELTSKAVKVIEKAFLRGEINGQQAIVDLVTLGIVQPRAIQYVQLWTYELAAEGIEVRAAQLQDWYVNHLIDQPTFIARLRVLGYSPGDSAMVLARANIKLAQAADRIEQQSIKAQELEAKKLAQAQQELVKQQEAIAKRMCASGTRSQVVSWAIRGFIAYPEAYHRLQQCGMTADDAIDLLALKQPKKGGLTIEQVRKAIASNGQTANATGPATSEQPPTSTRTQ